MELIGGREPAARTTSERWILVAFLLLVFGLFALEILREFHPAKLSAFFVLLFWFPLTALHEIGHAAVARLLGWRVSAIVVGFGRRIALFRLGRTQVELRLFPLSGYVIPSPERLASARWKSALIYLAGPAAEILLVVVLLLLSGAETLLQPSRDAGVIAVQSAALAAAIGIVLNLLPYSVATEGGSAASDGLGIIRSLMAPASSFERARAVPHLLEIEALLRERKPDEARRRTESALRELPESPDLLALLGSMLAEEGGFGAAAGKLRRAVEGVGPRAPERLSYLGELARLDLATGDEALLAEADEVSRLALEGRPGDAVALATRGAVLVELHRIHEGIECLDAAASLAHDREERVLCASYRVLAELRRGNVGWALEGLARLRKLEPRTWVFRWVDGEVAPRRAG